jgi:ribosomal protein S24E
MQIKIQQKVENKLLNRQDITFLVDHAGAPTPPRLEVRTKLAAMLNCKEAQLYIVAVAGVFGSSTSKGEARLYPSSEIALAREQKHILTRHKTKEERKAEEDKKAEAKAKEEEAKEKAPKKEAKAKEAKEEEAKAKEAKEEEAKEREPKKEGREKKPPEKEAEK